MLGTEDAWVSTQMRKDKAMGRNRRWQGCEYSDRSACGCGVNGDLSLEGNNSVTTREAAIVRVDALQIALGRLTSTASLIPTDTYCGSCEKWWLRVQALLVRFGRGGWLIGRHPQGTCQAPLFNSLTPLVISLIWFGSCI